jgi:hypothetical protein
MSPFSSLLLLCCFIACVHGANAEPGDKENDFNLIQTLLQRLDEHEQRIQALEVNDRNLRREVRELHFVARRKDSYLLRLKTLLTKQHQKPISTEIFALSEDLDKRGTVHSSDTVQENDNNSNEKRLPKNHELTPFNEDSKRLIPSSAGN